jgi:Methyltransferase domain
MMNSDGIAPYYETVERLCFGRALEQRRWAFLRDAYDSRYALICGGGDGRFLARLLGMNPQVEIDFVDSSVRMTLLAQQRIAGMGHAATRRVHFFIGDIREFTPRFKGYDLVATNFFLDCFTDQQVRNLIETVSSWTVPGAIWMVSEFRAGGAWFNRLWKSTIIRSLYLGFRITTGLKVKKIPNYSVPLLLAGFERTREESALRGLLNSSVWKRHPDRPTPCV